MMRNLTSIAKDIETFALEVGLPRERRARLLGLAAEIKAHEAPGPAANENLKSKKKVKNPSVP